MKMIKNYLYNITYQIFVLLLPFITVPYISRVLGPDGVGINAYTGSIVNYFVLFASLGINIYGNREIAYTRDNKRKMSRIFWELLTLKLLIVFVVYSIFLFFVLNQKSQYTPYYFAQSISLIAVAFDISWLYIGLEDLKKTVIRNLFVKITSLLLIFIFVKDSNDTMLYILILTVSSLIGNFTLFKSLNKIVINTKISWKSIWSHFKGSLILFIPQISIALYLDLNKTMLGVYRGPIEVGYFENANKVITIVLALLTATRSVVTPRIANLVVKEEFIKIKKMVVVFFKALSVLAFPMTFGLIAIAKDFAILFFGPEFEMSGYVLILLAPSLIFIAWSTALGQQYLIPLNRMKIYNQSIFITAIINVVLNFILIKPYGLWAATLLTTLSELIVSICQLYFLRRDFSIRELFSDVWKYLISAYIMMFSIIKFNSYFNFNVFILILDIIIGCFIYCILLFLLKVNVISEISYLIKNN